MSLIKCPKCGSILPDQAKVCPKCGKPNINKKDKISKPSKIPEPFANNVSKKFLLAGIITMSLFGLFGIFCVIYCASDVLEMLSNFNSGMVGLFTVIACGIMFREKNKVYNVLFYIVTVLALFSYIIQIFLFISYESYNYRGIFISPIIEYIVLSIILITGIILKIMGKHISILSFLIVVFLAIFAVVVSMEVESIIDWDNLFITLKFENRKLWVISLCFYDPLRWFPMIMNPLSAIVSAIIVISNIPLMIVNKKNNK